VSSIEIFGVFSSTLIGKSSTLREFSGLWAALSHPQVQNVVRNSVVRITMDSNASVRNLVKGGGPVHALCVTVKAIWQLCKSLGVTASFRWMRRDDFMMQKVDVLSKLNTLWFLLPDFEASVWQQFDLPITMPDLARCGPTVSAVIARQLNCCLVLPVWEGKSWWKLVLASASFIHQLPRMDKVVSPNKSGFPQWSFILTVFHF
jgi:hypothetical protein